MKLILELFSGYGSQSLALKRLGIDFESHISEIEPVPIKAYNMIHGDTLNYGDVTKIKESEMPRYDLITYSFPCQDISGAGKRQGLKKDSGTRSSLLWECERIITATKPSYLLMENVKDLVNQQNMPDFKEWLKTLYNIGYNNWWFVLNGKDFNVPQNRERVFCVSIRKDIDQGYIIPKGRPLKKLLKDILEKDVDEKYYLNQEQVDKFMASNFSTTQRRLQEKDWCDTLCARDYKGPKCLEVYCAASRGRNPENSSDRTTGALTEQRLEINKTGCTNTLTSVQKDNYIVQVGNLVDKSNYENPQRGRVYSPHGISPALNTCQGGGLEPKIMVKANTKIGFEYLSDGDSLNLEQPSSQTRRGRVGKQVAQTLTCSCNQAVYNTRIRKLTPRECFRLMGVDDSDFNKLKGISNSRLYKMAGNSIIVDVLVEIFRNLLIDKVDKKTAPPMAEQTDIFDFI